MRSSPHAIPLAQGIYYAVTGLWPVVHLRSFEAVSGPKVDKWLVRTIGGLIAAVGVSLIAGSFERRSSRALRVLGVGSAAALGLADIVYAARGRISKVYLGDAVIQGGLVASWVVRRARRRAP
jgi:energy-converting hydrogenase Eha subunit E